MQCKAHFYSGLLLSTKLTLRAFGKKVNPKSCYRTFVPTNFVKLNRYLFLHKKYYIQFRSHYIKILSFNVLKELSCSCNVQPFEKSKCWFFQSLIFIYFVKRAMGDYCLMILCFLVIYQYKGGEEWLQGRWRPCIVC